MRSEVKQPQVVSGRTENILEALHVVHFHSRQQPHPTGPTAATRSGTRCRRSKLRIWDEMVGHVPSSPTGDWTLQSTTVG
ncbi:hypothetical protein GN956_G11525 [Arapaima gigas]